MDRVIAVRRLQKETIVTETPFNTVGGQFGTPTDPQAQAGFAQQGFGIPQQAPQQFVPGAQPGFGPAPQQAPQQFAQPGFGPAPQQGGYPQGYMPQAGYVPQQVPAPPLPPLPEPVYVHADALMPDGSNAAVGQSHAAPAEKHKLSEDLGKPCFMRVAKVFARHQADKQTGVMKVQEIAVVDRIVIDMANPANSQVYTDNWIFNGPVVKDIKETISRGLAFHEGRPVEKPLSSGRKAVILQPLTDEEHDIALKLAGHLGWFNQTPGQPVAAPAAQAAPQAQPQQQFAPQQAPAQAAPQGAFAGV